MHQKNLFNLLGENNEIERPPRSRKRQSVETWKRNERRRARAKGEQYISSRGKNIQARIMGPGCGVKCRFYCSDKITREERINIFHEYYKIEDVERQRDFIGKTEKPTSQELERSTKNIPDENGLWNGLCIRMGTAAKSVKHSTYTLWLSVKVLCIQLLIKFLMRAS